MTGSISRAEFIRRIGAAYAVALFGPSLPPLDRNALEHPEPRAGITSDKVLKVEDLGEKPRKSVLDAYAAARENPQVFDGLACACGCHGDAAHQHRSLLVCYETRQPTGCYGCQQEASFVGRMAKDGKSLADIRAAVDKKFGD